MVKALLLDVFILLNKVIFVYFESCMRRERNWTALVRLDQLL